MLDWPELCPRRCASILGAAGTLIVAPLAVAQPGQGNGGLGGLSAVGTSPDCIPAWERARVFARIAAYQRNYGVVAHSGSDGPSLYPFHPLAGRLYSDIPINNYVDLDPTSPGILDYACGPFTYDGHGGIDSDLRWRDDQLIGVPIFAALDGTVVDRDDGHPDQNTDCDNNPPANYVVIDHGNGRQSFYWHMKSGSVAVSVNQQVKSGQQIGMAASSGCSTGPHLHFESHNGGNVYEAFAGPCRAGPSGWLHQEDPPSAPYLADFGVTTVDLSTQPGYPIRYPTSSEIPLSAPLIYFWDQVGALPANATYQFIFIRPDGTTDYSSNVYPFNNTDYVRHGTSYFAWNIFDMHTITGMWHVKILFNGQLMVNAPVEVVQTVTGLNHPPQPVSLAFDPTVLTASDAILCRVLGSPAVADLDWDLVRYHYVWKRNGAVVRDTTTTGLMDALPRGANRDIVECTVTPNDGHVDGLSATIRVDIGCYANCDTSTVAPVLNANDFQCFLNRFAAADPAANCDGSTAAPVLNANDFQCFLNAFAAGCS